MAVDPFFLQQQLEILRRTPGINGPVQSGSANAMPPMGPMPPPQQVPAPIPGPPTQRPTFSQRLAADLQNPNNQYLLNLGLGMLGASGQGLGAGAALNQGFAQANRAMENAYENSLRRQQAERQDQLFEMQQRQFEREERQADRAERQQRGLTAGRLAVGLQANARDMPAYWQMVAGMPEVQQAVQGLGIEAPSTLNPQDWQTLQGQLAAAGAVEGPYVDGRSGQTADIQNWQFYQNLSPEQQKQWMALQRQPTAPQLSVVNGVPSLVDRINGTVTPLSSLTGEVGAQQALAAAKSSGQVVGEAAGTVQKQGTTAGQTLDTLDLADSLIDSATGSLVGAGVDKLVGVFGYAPEGAEAISQLRVLQANLMTTMPRMEGPQSDRDVDLYRQAAGQIGDPTVPRDLKKAAVQTIRQLQRKYQQRAGMQPQQGPQRQGQAPPAALEYLRANPQFKDQFRAKYGYLPEGL